MGAREFRRFFAFLQMSEILGIASTTYIKPASEICYLSP